MPPSIPAKKGAVNSSDVAIPSNVIWGAKKIGAAIGRNPRQAHWLLANGKIACARRCGRHWIANLPALLAEFGAQ